MLVHQYSLYVNDIPTLALVQEEGNKHRMGQPYQTILYLFDSVTNPSLQNAFSYRESLSRAYLPSLPLLYPEVSFIRRYIYQRPSISTSTSIPTPHRLCTSQEPHPYFRLRPRRSLLLTRPHNGQHRVLSTPETWFLLGLPERQRQSAQ